MVSSRDTHSPTAATLEEPTIQHTTDGRTFSYSFDVLGGVKYIVEVRAETIKPGPSVTGTKQVPVYSK